MDILNKHFDTKIEPTAFHLLATMFKAYNIPDWKESRKAMKGIYANRKNGKTEILIEN